MDSIVMEILRAYHTNRWDLVAMRSFILIDLLPDMIAQMNITAIALSRREHRKDELTRVAVSLKRLMSVIGDDALGFLREPRAPKQRQLDPPEGDKIGRITVPWLGHRSR